MVKRQWREPDGPALEEPVAAVLRAAAAPTEPGPQPGEKDALAAFRATEHISRRSPMHSSRTKFRAGVVAAVTSGVMLTSGLAAAATGTLPGAAQDTARDWLTRVGVTVPGADEHAAGHADERGGSETQTEPADTTETTTDQTSDDVTEDSTDDSSEGTEESKGKGAVISQMATTTDKTGVEKGAEISTYASNGKSKAGQNGQAGEESGKPEEPGKSSEGRAHRPAPPTTGSDDSTSGDDSGDAGSSGGASGHGAGAAHQP